MIVPVKRTVAVTSQDQVRSNYGQRGKNSGSQRAFRFIPGRRFEFPLQAQVTSDRSQVDRFVRFHALQIKDNVCLQNRASKHQEWRSKAESQGPIITLRLRYYFLSVNKSAAEQRREKRPSKKAMEGPLGHSDLCCRLLVLMVESAASAASHFSHSYSPYICMLT